MTLPLPFDVRVENALTKIKQQKDWSQEQLSWLERLASSLKEQVAIEPLKPVTTNAVVVNAN